MRWSKVSFFTIFSSLSYTDAHEKISWTEKVGGLQCIGPQTVGHGWATKYEYRISKRDGTSPLNMYLTTEGFTWWDLIEPTFGRTCFGTCSCEGYFPWNYFKRTHLKFSLPNAWRVIRFSNLEVLRPNPERWCCESAALNMPANTENSAVATALEKVPFHSNPKERQCQRTLKLPHNCTHLTRW